VEMRAAGLVVWRRGPRSENGPIGKQPTIMGIRQREEPKHTCSDPEEHTFGIRRIRMTYQLTRIAF